MDLWEQTQGPGSYDVSGPKSSRAISMHGKISDPVGSGGNEVPGPGQYERWARRLINLIAPNSSKFLVIVCCALSLIKDGKKMLLQNDR